MARLYLVRHGRAAAAYGVSNDPGLDEQGQKQAEIVAARLARLGPLPIRTSPLKRTRETAVPLAALWKTEPAVDEAVAEIPSPGLALEQRAQWLRAFMQGSWREAGVDLAGWREALVTDLKDIKDDTVIFSHYVAINVAAGAALGDDRVVVFSPDNCSVTVFETTNDGLTLVERGHEADLTRVN